MNVGVILRAKLKASCASSYINEWRQRYPIAKWWCASEDWLSVRPRGRWILINRMYDSHGRIPSDAFHDWLVIYVELAERIIRVNIIISRNQVQNENVQG